MKNVSLAVVSVSAILVLAGCTRDPAKDAPAAGAAPAAEAPAETMAGEKVAIDVASSKLGWTASKVTKTHIGGFKSFQGAVMLVEGKPEASQVNVEIDVASLYTDSEKLEGHLRSKDFFEVETYPKATFVSTSIKPVDPKAVQAEAEGAAPTHTVTGNLTLHGVTKEISFPATIAVEDKQVTANSRFSLNRKDFGIVYPGAPDDLIRDDVLIEWMIVGKRGQQSASK